MYEQTFPDNWEAYRHGGTPEEKIEGNTLLERVNNLIKQEADEFSKMTNLDETSKKRQEFKDLWNYLTALRGPDSNDGYGSKNLTTGVIRGKLDGFNELAFVAKATSSPNHKTICLDCANQAGMHFRNHIKWAAEVVDIPLKYCENHKIKPSKDTY